ncbi:hypothetical protein EGW08_003747 [Elysia chlorotica]|uniref:Uncharacterized protein n=1 Tax=Elysia chlorotica TaxID=188477 RepID=A0A433U3U0_ELYCH|nr:hypothetical protein EGW08_003747 [Elysia chlorotica]
MKMHQTHTHTGRYPHNHTSSFLFQYLNNFGVRHYDCPNTYCLLLLCKLQPFMTDLGCLSPTIANQFDYLDTGSCFFFFFNNNPGHLLSTFFFKMCITFMNLVRFHVNKLKWKKG